MFIIGFWIYNLYIENVCVNVWVFEVDCISVVGVFGRVLIGCVVI